MLQFEYYYKKPYFYKKAKRAKRQKPKIRKGYGYASRGDASRGDRHLGYSSSICPCDYCKIIGQISWYFEVFSYLCRLYGRYKRKVQAIQGVGATAARGCPTL